MHLFVRACFKSFFVVFVYIFLMLLFLIHNSCDYEHNWFCITRHPLTFFFFYLGLQRISKLTVKILMSVVLRERTHPGFHGSVACEAMNSFVRSMMTI